ncbi:DUF1259 domain-containing protein [Paracidobacterium acidisoli]|uniref:DUF1259 domain-containing protein n=1 Tax=Paracidobacterium acidisoli TaxID=2303751 RepID=A0A372IQ28_9BACT|nr:DUF1259 domain-containing protein [Paracidobacterium acidisoli]MBT9330942.1 DUF1259 domain-containing protein [Paracidobacterium acidisoli]
MFLVKRRPVVRAFALAVALTTTLCAKSFAAPDWTPIQTALQANGVELPGNVLRFELSRQDLPVTANGQTLAIGEIAAVANGFVAFKPIFGHDFFVDGALPAQETELGALQTALRKDSRIHITAVINHSIGETPKLIWVHFEALGSGADLATSLATALKVIHSPQIGNHYAIGTNSIIDPSQLPAPFQKLFNEGTVEQFNGIFVFYLPRPNEQRLFVDGVRGESGLGVGHSFYIQFSFSGGTTATLNVELALRSGEIQAVEDILRAGGFTISSASNHFVNDTPHLYFVHATATGDGFTLGTALVDAIDTIRSANRDHRFDF